MHLKFTIEAFLLIAGAVFIGHAAWDIIRARVLKR